MVEKVLTKHPEEGKAGVSIDKEKYEMIRGAIFQLVRDNGEIAFKDLVPEVGKLLAEKFEGSISWYVTTVKLDLEARGLITRVPKASPQRIRLTE